MHFIVDYSHQSLEISKNVRLKYENLQLIVPFQNSQEFYYASHVGKYILGGNSSFSFLILLSLDNENDKSLWLLFCVSTLVSLNAYRIVQICPRLLRINIDRSLLKWKFNVQYILLFSSQRVIRMQYDHWMIFRSINTIWVNFVYICMHYIFLEPNLPLSYL